MPRNSNERPFGTNERAALGRSLIFLQPQDGLIYGDPSDQHTSVTEQGQERYGKPLV